MRSNVLYGIISFVVTIFCIAGYLLPGVPFITERSHLVRLTADIRRQHLTASFVLSFDKTHVDLTYKSPLRLNSSALVQATINQTQEFIRAPGYPDNGDDLPTPDTITSLLWPIEATLNSSGFSWAPSENTKTIVAGSHLPAVVSWAPILTSDADIAVLVLRFKNINGSDNYSSSYINDPDPYIQLTINGKSSVAGANDEIPLTIPVYKNGMPVWLWEYLTIGAAIASFIFGSSVILGGFSRAWTWITGTRKRDRSHRPHA